LEVSLHRKGSDGFGWPRRKKSQGLIFIDPLITQNISFVGIWHALSKAWTRPYHVR
jgi:hypothetical protein